MAEPLPDFESALLADLAAFEARMQAQVDKLQATAQSNFDKFQQSNKEMQALLTPAAQG